MAPPKLWNDRALFIRNISTVNSFKKSLKTHLFQKAFFLLIFFIDFYVEFVLDMYFKTRDVLQIF